MALPVDMGARWTASKTEVGRYRRMMGDRLEIWILLGMESSKRVFCWFGLIWLLNLALGDFLKEGDGEDRGCEQALAYRQCFRIVKYKKKQRLSLASFYNLNPLSWRMEFAPTIANSRLGR